MNIPRYIETLNYKITFKIILMLIIVVFAYAANYFLNVALANLLPMQDYGNFSVIKEILLLSSIILLQGSDFSALKFVPEYIKSKKFSLLKGYLLNNLINFALVSIILLFLGTIIGFLIIFLMLLFAFARYLSELLRSFQHVFLGTLFFDLFVPLLFVLCCGFLLLIHKHVHLSDILFFYIFILGLIVTTECCGLLILMPKKIFSCSAVKLKKIWNKTSRQLMTSRFVLTILFSSEIILLKIFGSNPKDVGIFGAILTVGSLYWLIFNAVTYVLTPLISPHAEDKSKLQSLFDISALITFILVTVLTVIIVAFDKPILNYFGPDYVKGFWPLIIVIVGFSFTVVLGLPWYFIGLSGHQHRLVKPVIFIAVFSIIFTSILIHFFNLLGAAIGLALTDIIMAVWLIIIMKSYVGIKLRIF